MDQAIGGIETGDVVGRYEGRGGAEIAVAVRLPSETWDELTAALEALELVERRSGEDDDNFLQHRIAVFLDFVVQDLLLRIDS